MSWIITGQEAGSLGLLDQYGGAAAAYSLRNLSLYHTDPVVRVRRDNDDAEEDFTATEVSDGTLAAWVGAGNNGFVRTWYDQTSNGFHMAQATTTLQPQIVSNGSVIVVTSTPAIQLASDNTSGGVRLVVAGLVPSQPITIFGAANRTSTADRQVLYANANATLQFAAHVEADVRNSAGAALNYQALPTLGKQLHYGLYNYASSEAAVNGAAATTGNVGASGITPNSQISSFAINNAYQWIGHIFELLIYSFDQSANRAGIEANINAHYSIF